MRPKNLVRDSEIRRVVELAKELGLTIGAIDVRVDGVTMHTAAQPVEKGYDRQKRLERERRASLALIATIQQSASEARQSSSLRTLPIYVAGAR
jgi:hypothetical protein